MTLFGNGRVLVCPALADKGALPSLWECGGCAYMNGRRQPIPRSLSLFIGASNEVEKRASSVCSAVTDIFKSAAVGQPRLMVGEPVSLTVKLKFAENE